jgi:hypothetical protein
VICRKLSSAALETDMKLQWLVVVVVGLGFVATDPALARARHKAKPRCTNPPAEFSWRRLWESPAPRPNGCSPPVFVDGEFIGQDPDKNIRFQLMRDPDTGYKPRFN